jgi:hypothetical protein
VSVADKTSEEVQASTSHGVKANNMATAWESVTAQHAARLC